MGACQSRQPAVVIVDDNLRELTAKQDPNKCSGNTPSAASQTTGITRESWDLLSESACQGTEESVLLPEEPIRAVISGASIPTLESEEDLRLSQGRPKHVRKKSSIVKDYLQSEGASWNRTMVHIETPFGLPIEEVYEGVHTGKVLGEGIAGKVRLITHRDTGIQRAVKRLDLSVVTSNEDMDSLLDEIKIMCCLDHPLTVCLEEVFEGENELFLTQELLTGGDLFDRLDEQPNFCYTEAGCARLIRQIIRSVSYLHSKDIIHRDLKLENFLFQDQSEQSELKLIDFGLSKHFVRGEIQHETVGTPYTIAPEVISGKGYDEKSDVWGIGVIAYLLLSGDTPFGGACEGEDLNEVRKNILSGEVSFEGSCWDNVSEAAIGFIKSLLVLDPEQRPIASELKNHPWLKLMKRNISLESDESPLSQTVVDGLVSFKELSSTRKFLREVISYTLQPDQISGLHEEFEKIDVDGTGEISLHCFKQALIANSDQHPLTENEIEDIFNGLKVRRTDLSIRWHEFIAACLSQCHIDDRNIRLAFDRLDTEHKGFITLKDLKSAMEFYGTYSRYDLQSMWINSVIDYKKERDHLAFDEFYKLLKLDKNNECGSPIQLLKKQTPPQTGRAGRVHHSSLTRSYSCVRNIPVVDKETLDLLTSPLNDTSSKHNWSQSRRHSLGPVLNLDLAKILLDGQEPAIVSNMRANRDIHDFILEASKHLEDEKKRASIPRRTTITGTGGLFLRRSSQEYAPSPHLN